MYKTYLDIYGHIVYTENMDKLLTVKEVAEILRVSEKTIFRYIKAGDLKAYRIKKLGSWRIKEKEIETLLDIN